MISVSQLTKSYAGRVAVDGISFEVAPGEIVGFLGPNGAGKSTTMRILSGYMPPTSGTATVGGKDVFRESLAVRSQVGYMPENAPLYLEMAVKEYLHFRGALKGLSGKDLRVRTGEVMELCGVTEVRRRLIGNLSKGYRQRVALADALIHRPPLLILDEPTNDLDILTLNVLEEYLADFPGCLIIVTHDRYFMDKLVDHLFVLEGDGKIRDYNGTYSEYRELKKAEVREKQLEEANQAPSIEDNKGKASFEQRKDFARIEKEIKKLEEKRAEITAKFDDASLSPEKIMELSKELDTIAAQLSEKEEKWFELAEMM